MPPDIWLLLGAFLMPPAPLVVANWIDIETADMNDDGSVDGLDIGLFILSLQVGTARHGDLVGFPSPNPSLFYNTSGIQTGVATKAPLPQIVASSR